MGGRSYSVDNPLDQLRMAAASCFFGEPMYYHGDQTRRRKNVMTMDRWCRLDNRQLQHLRETLDAKDPREWRGMEPAELMESAIDAALGHDPEGTLQLAVELRGRTYNIRTTPQVIMVRAAHHPSVKGTGLVRKYAQQVMVRADEPAVQLAYQIQKYGRQRIPNALKKAWKLVLEGFSEYQLAKYRMESREVKLVDVVNICHPASDAVSKLSKGELKVTGDTWEALISEKGSTKAAWRESIEKMGHMALLRNLRNLTQAGVDPKEFVGKLVDGAPEGRQLPFRYFAAYNALKAENPSPLLLDAVEECLEVAILENVPVFKGRCMSLCDNSGSAWGSMTSSSGTMHVAEIGNLTGVITGMASEEGYAGVFGDRLVTMPIRKKASVFEQTEQLNRKGQRIGAGTENGIWLFWDQAIKNGEHWDHVFVYSDMQAGHGGLYGVNSADYMRYVWPGSGNHIDVPKLIIEYRNKVNPNVMVYLVQIAGYQDTIVPEFYDRTFILGGWSDAILRFAGEMSGSVPRSQRPQQ